MKYIIIGNSAAAVGCIEGIRQVDRQGEILVISSEPHHTYSRPLISYYLYGKTDLERMKYRPDNFYDINRCRFLPGKAVTKLDSVNKSVTLEDGSIECYDRLLVATGSRAFVPPIPGLETVEQKYTFMTLADAKRIQKEVSEDAKVLILGAGLIGLKCAEGLSAKTSHITVVDLADHILPSILDAAGAEMVQKHLEDHGLSFLLGESVTAFSGNSAILQSGETLSFDVLVLAVGVRPNSDLVADAGGSVEKGILTDIFCRTSLPDVFAAGDCTESEDITIDQSRVLALLPNAYMQGECAGVNMAGGEKRYDKAIPMNAISFFGLHVLTAGSYEGEQTLSYKEGSYKRLIYRDNLLKGFILIGAVARAGIYTSLIREKTPLDTIDFALIKENPKLMAFSKIERKKVLGGAAV